jgi:hypothetical protein
MGRGNIHTYRDNGVELGPRCVDIYFASRVNGIRTLAERSNGLVEARVPLRYTLKFEHLCNQ